MTSADAAALRTSLESITTGDFRGWTPLQGPYIRANLQAALPELESGPDGELLFGAAAKSLRLPPSPGAPFGVTLWFQDEELVLVQVREPRPAGSIEAMLGPPEADAPSQLGSSRSQWVYARLGLVFHVSDVTGEVFRLYAFEPVPLEQLLASPLASVRLDRIPRRG